MIIAGAGISTSRGLNNRAEELHLPTRQQERRMQPSKSHPEQAQRFLEPFSTVCSHFHGGVASRRRFAVG